MQVNLFYQDDLGINHSYLVPVKTVPRIGETVVFQGKYYKVYDIVNRVMGACVEIEVMLKKRP